MIKDKIYYIPKTNSATNEPPMDGTTFCIYVHQKVILDMLEKLKVVCGHRAMRYVEKQIKIIEGL